MKTVRQQNNIGFSRRDLIAAAGTGAALGMLSHIDPASAQNKDAPILTRPIPHSGEMLPVVGVGTSQVFQIGTDASERAQRRAVIEALSASGGKLIDTGSTYGTAEGVIGDLVQETGLRDKLFIATKGEVRNRSASIAEFQESLRRLKTPKVDLMQLHNVSSARQDLALYREWKQQGLCRYIGITTSFESDQDAVAGCAQREKPDFVQVNYSLTDRSAEKRVLPASKEAGAAVLCNLPFGRGELFRKVRGKQLPEWAAEFNAATWGQFFLKFLLSHEAVTAVIPGTAKAEHMRDNLGAGRGKLPNDELRKRMISLIDTL
jgi:aryl-alcohol dehydrogenase-like predicted oxidoreductase